MPINEIKDGRVQLNAKTLKNLRAEHGLSQETLAERCTDANCFVSISTIKRAESGKNVLYRSVQTLAAFFNVSVEHLLTET